MSPEAAAAIAALEARVAALEALLNPVVKNDRTMRCHFVRDKKTGQRLFIPYCYGSINGAGDNYQRCTCERTK